MCTNRSEHQSFYMLCVDVIGALVMFPPKLLTCLEGLDAFTLFFKQFNPVFDTVEGKNDARTHVPTEVCRGRTVKY